MKKISIITGVYNESATVEEVHSVINKLFVNIKKYDYEHIFMDNCSTDNTLEILKKIAMHDKKVKVLAYSRNFGPIKTELTGYQYASGDAVIPFEANLKDPVELIIEFIKKWEEGFDVVYGIRVKTKDNIILSVARKLFYRIINFFSEEKIPLNAGSFRLVDRTVVNELVKLDDYKPYIRGLISSIGFKQIGIEYTRKSRLRGHSKSKFSYLIDFSINALVNYSILPIRFCTYLGLFLFIVSFLTVFVFFISKLFFWPTQSPALAALIILVLFFSGIQLFFLGIIGEYVGAIHSQVRKKPFVVIAEKINFDDLLKKG
jgi:glycosyltransferase involved in cell wall biosynthesis